MKGRNHLVVQNGNFYDINFKPHLTIAESRANLISKYEGVCYLTGNYVNLTISMNHWFFDKMIYLLYFDYKTTKYVRDIRSEHMSSQHYCHKSSVALTVKVAITLADLMALPVARA